MSGFKWTDRFGVVRTLEAPAAIEAEADEISAEIDEAINKSKNAPRDMVVAYRVQIRDLVGRLNALRSDADRWNDYAFEQAKVAAKRRVEEIDAFIEAAWDIVTLASLHEDRTETFAREDDRAAALAGPATDAQRRAIARSDREPKPSEGLTRAEAEEWLDGDPAYWRPMTDEGGWFPWVDADGTAHRLASPLQIELEVAKLAMALDELIPTLIESKSIIEIDRALEETNVISARILVLESDLERFALEQIRQEDEEWENFDQEWEHLKVRRRQVP
jgi:hypothetical protein